LVLTVFGFSLCRPHGFAPTGDRFAFNLNHLKTFFHFREGEVLPQISRVSAARLERIVLFGEQADGFFEIK
jgi:hypothetical protein